MAHGKGKISQFPIKRIHVLWKTRHELVEKEVLRLREEEGRMNPTFEQGLPLQRILLII